MCGFLLTDKYISSRRFIKQSELEFAIINEKRRACLIIITCSLLNFIIFFFFNFRNRLEEIDKNYKNDIEKYKEKMEYFIKYFKMKIIIGTFLVLILHSAFLLFILIFFSIHSNTQLTYIAYLILSFIGYFLFYFIILLIAATIRAISLCKRNYFFEKLYQLSSFIADLL